MTQQLSPAAEAVLNASMKHSGPAFEPLVRKLVADALRAVAFNLRSDEFETCNGSSYSLMIDQDDLIALADEIEAA